MNVEKRISDVEDKIMAGGCSRCSTGVVIMVKPDDQEDLDLDLDRGRCPACGRPVAVMCISEVEADL